MGDLAGENVDRVVEGSGVEGGRAVGGAGDLGFEGEPGLAIADPALDGEVFEVEAGGLGGGACEGEEQKTSEETGEAVHGMDHEGEVFWIRRWRR